MSRLLKLSAALHQATVGSLHLKPPDLKPLEREITAVRDWLGDRGSARPSSDALRSALDEFFQRQEMRSCRQAVLTCFGCADAVLSTTYRLIEDDIRFPKLLASIGDYRTRPRSFRPLYLGLLNAYFGYDGDRASSLSGRENWRRLRAYLRDSADSLVAGGVQPTWIAALDANRQLLDDDPGRFYGASILEGGEEEFEELRRTLDIRRDSWLVRRLVLGQIDAAVAKADANFQQLLPKLLELLVKNLVVDVGLAGLLNRYRACRNPEEHPGLRDFSVAQWGNPWLTANSAKWSLVGRDAREMVVGWLKRDLIRRFFSVLAADGRNDDRRLKFWERYCASIHDMYFALGSSALRHPGADFRHIRDKIRERLLELHSAGPRINNAFIMCIVGYVVVEFGIKGNACFVFKREGLPFALVGNVAGNGDALKHEKHVERLLHVDSNFETWEAKFERTLSRLTGARPSTIRFEVPPPVPPQPPVRTQLAPVTPQGTSRPTQSELFAAPPPAAKAPTEPSSEFTMAALSRFCALHGLQIDDRRGQNGCLWVRTHNLDGPVTKQLQAWGFQYKNAFKGWWRE